MKPPPASPWKPDPQLLAAYFDGELDERAELADLRSRLEAWLEQHSDALAEAEKTQRLHKLWLETAPLEPSSEVWNQILARIEETARQKIAHGGSHTSWLVPGACAIGIVLCCGLLFGSLRWSLTPADQENPIASVPRQIVPAAEVEMFPVATADEVVILRVEGEDAGTLVVGKLPLTGPLELAASGEIHIVNVKPDDHDQMMPHVRQDGHSRPMIWARLDTERE